MKLPVKTIKPFGPSILECKCPQNIVNQLNEYTDDVCSDEEKSKLCSSKYGNIPNLLLRDFESVFLTEKFAIEIGLKSFVETLGNYYLDKSDDHIAGNFSGMKLSIYGNADGILEDFPFQKEQQYVDCWINRYFSGDYTPPHTHGSDLAGIIFLKVPEELEEENTKDVPHNSDEISRIGGKLIFNYGILQSFQQDLFLPEQSEGNVLIFPSWLSHMVFPMKTNSERRTLSFNLVNEKRYYSLGGKY